MNRPLRSVLPAAVFVPWLVWAGCDSETSAPAATTTAGVGGDISAGGAGAAPGGSGAVGGSGGAGGAPIDPLAFGPKVLVGDGTDPDVAVDSQGRMHVAYVRSGSIYYRRVDPPSTVGQEVPVGSGIDPQLVVDSLDEPHVVFGALHYARWNGAAFDAPMQLASAWRKPRVAIDGSDRIYATVDHDVPREVHLHVVDDGVVVASDVVVGDDNSGSIAVDSSDVAHLSWRGAGGCSGGQPVHYNTFQLGVGAGTSECLHGSSDFSWLAIDPRDDAVHLVNTVPHAQGINYQVRRAGAWSAVQTLALAETQDEPEPDNVGPTIAVDAVGHGYIALSGAHQVPYVLLIYPDDQVSAVLELDPEDHTTAGGKFHNPNVGCHPGRRGACVAWHADPADVIYVRCIGTAP